MFPSRRYGNCGSSLFIANTSQPTGGVVLLIDTQSSESKSLVERKVKKAAPRAAPSAADTSASAAAPSSTVPATPLPSSGADAAAVLNSIDEDVEGGEEAEVPGEFDYLTDAETEE